MSYVFLINPLFIFFYERPWVMAGLQKEMEIDILDDQFDGNIKRQMEPRNSNDLEITLINHPEAKNLQQQFKTFWNQKYLYKNLEFTEIPIALITFLFSIFISTDLQF